MSDKDWAVYLEPAEISRGIFRIFGSQLPKLAFEKSNENKPAIVEETNDKNESVNSHESSSNDMNLTSKRIQQDTMMETINEGDGDIVKEIDEDTSEEEIVLKKVAFQRILAACTIVTFLESHGGEGFSSNRKKLMASLSQYMKDVNMNQTATRLKVSCYEMHTFSLPPPLSLSLSLFVSVCGNHGDVFLTFHKSVFFIKITTPMTNRLKEWQQIVRSN